MVVWLCGCVVVCLCVCVVVWFCDSVIVWLKHLVDIGWGFVNGYGVVF